MKTFIVNLERDIEKKENMDFLCKNYSMVTIPIVATDGLSLDYKLIKNIYSSYLAQAVFGRELSLPEIGCALSHIEIYKRMIHDNIEHALILEDDVYFDQDLINIQKLIHKFPLNWDLILLGHHSAHSRIKESLVSLWYHKRLNNNYKLVRFAEKTYGTYGYIISKSGATKLLKELSMIVKPIDHYTGSDKLINLYGVSPACVHINDLFTNSSNITASRQVLSADTSNKKVTSIMIVRSFFITTKNTFLRYYSVFKILRSYK
jgi:glycosyl transferase family 25